MKKMVVAVAVLLVLALVGAALAEEFTTERIPMTILGQPAMMVRTVRQGGPLKGFFGNSAQAQSTYGLNAKGELVCLSTTQSNADGIGKAMLQGVPQAAMYGGMNIIAAGQIRPDNNSVQVPVNVKNSNRASNSNFNVNKGGSAVSVSGASARADADASAAAAASATGGNINGNQNPGNPNN